MSPHQNLDMNHKSSHFRLTVRRSTDRFWVVPPAQASSHHQDYYIFRIRDPNLTKPSFATIASWEGGQPNPSSFNLEDSMSMLSEKIPMGFDVFPQRNSGENLPLIFFSPPRFCLMESPYLHLPTILLQLFQWHLLPRLGSRVTRIVGTIATWKKYIHFWSYMSRKICRKHFDKHAFFSKETKKKICTITHTHTPIEPYPCYM